MDIITGYTGTPHITAENDRDINIGIFGNKSYVLQTGTMLTAEISNNNEIKVRDGVIMHQGCAASIKKNTYDSVTINNGSQGMKRIDLIVARYEKQPETNVESLTLKVLQGTPAETSPQVPAHTEGDIQAGDTVADMPLYEVEIDGLNITEIRKVFQTMGDLESVNGKISITANGICKKYNNGIMEQYIKVDRNTSAWAAWKYMYYAEVAAVDYIEPFKDITYLDIYLQSNNVAVGQMTLDNGTLAKTSSMYALRPDTANPLTVTVYVHVIGRWK